MDVISNGAPPLLFIRGSHGLARHGAAAIPLGTDIRSQWEAATSKGVSRCCSGLVGRPAWSADSPSAPTAPNFGIWAVLVSLVLIPWGVACPTLVCFGLWACFDPIEPESCSLIGLLLLPCIAECVFLLMKCVFTLISSAYKYLPTLVETVSNKPLPLG